MSRERTAEFRPDYALPPGEYLAIVLDRLGMTQADLAARTGLSTKHVNQIINRGASVTADTAAQLEYATDVPAELWAALDARHHALMARSRARMRLESALDWLDRFNLKELADRGVVPEAKRGVGTLEALLRFFGIADPDGWDRVWVPSIASFRRSPSFAPDATATTVWLRAGQRLANEIVAKPFNERALLDAMPELRRMTCAEPADALSELQELMRGFGIAVVYVAEFDGCRASGATWWATPSKAVVMLSNRGKREDRFWFSFFHEIGHVLFHAKRDTFIDQNRSEDSDDDRPPWDDPAPASGFIDDGSRDSHLEEEADEFASATLIPREHLPDIPRLSTLQAVVELAARIGVSAGVVAGRYQYETGDYTKFNRLRRKVPHGLFTEIH